MSKNQLIFVAGHKGMVGAALCRALLSKGYENLLTVGKEKMDLCDQSQVRAFFEEKRPNTVFLAAARVGGIKANRDYPADFLYQNLAIQTNVIHEAWRSGVSRFVFLGSSCIYPRECPQPIREEYLLTSPLETTNEAYAIAKIAGVKMVEFYRKQYGFNAISLMPCNLYGPNDHFDLNTSHVLPALVRRFVDAAQEGAPNVTLWGTGTPLREFLHVDELAAAALFLSAHSSAPALINVGSGTDLSIKELAIKIAEIAGYKGEICWDTSMPDGTPRKCLDISRLKALGFMPRISLDEGIPAVVEEYKRRKAAGSL